MMQRDSQLLLSLVRAALDAPPDVARDPEDPSKADWKRLLDSAHRHRLSGLAFEGSRRVDFGEQLPVEARDRLSAAYQATLARNAVLLHHAERLAAAAFLNGYPVALLKGAAFATRLYAHIALRPMTDIDILVRADDLPRLIDLANKLGYQRIERTDHAVSLKHRETETYLELHTSLTSCPRYIGVDTESLLQRSEKASLGNVPLRTLSPEDHLLHLCLHASFQHGLRQPAINACDAFLLAQSPRFDWAGFLARASAPRRAPLVAAGLALSHAVLPHRKLGWALEALTALIRPSQRECLRTIVTEDLLASSPEAVSGSPWSRFQWTSRLRDRAALVRETLRPGGSNDSALLGVLSRGLGLLRRHGPAWRGTTILAQGGRTGPKARATQGVPATQGAHRG